jgi:hypothetical protein
MPSQCCRLGRYKHASNMGQLIVLQLAGEVSKGGEHVGCDFWLIAHYNNLRRDCHTDKGDLQLGQSSRSEDLFSSSGAPACSRC